jgi:hypothetical protein
MLTRRRFFGVVAASVALPSMSARRQPSNEWGSPVFDLFRKITWGNAHRLLKIQE